MTVTLRDLSWQYRRRQSPAFHHVNLTVEQGEKVLITGASGSGKSTLLAAIAGLLDPEDGDLTGSATTSGRVGMVLQDPETQAVYSRVGDDVAFGCENLAVPREEIWRRVPEALAAVGLDVPLDFPVSKLSGGQKQRLALAGVIAMRPAVILLDEPTAAIDPASIEQLRDAVLDVAETLIVVEHRIGAWEPYMDRTLLLDGDLREADEDEMAEHGVWVRQPATPGFRAGGEPVLWTRGLRTRAGAVPDLTVTGATAITGRNGAGKTSLALTLGGLLRPVAGGVETSFGAPSSWKPKELARRMGQVFQNPEHHFIARTVREELGGAMLEALRLEDVADAHPMTLSGGQKRRLAVGVAALGRPPVMLLDEPTFGQDTHSFTAVLELLASLDSTIVAVTHDPALAAAFPKAVDLR